MLQEEGAEHLEDEGPQEEAVHQAAEGVLQGVVVLRGVVALRVEAVHMEEEEPVYLEEAVLMKPGVTI